MGSRFCRARLRAGLLNRRGVTHKQSALRLPKLVYHYER